MVAIVGKISPPQIVLVNETGSLFEYAITGVLGKYWLLSKSKPEIKPDFFEYRWKKAYYLEI